MGWGVEILVNVKIVVLFLKLEEVCTFFLLTDLMAKVTLKMIGRIRFLSEQNHLSLQLEEGKIILLIIKTLGLLDGIHGNFHLSKLVIYCTCTRLFDILKGKM